MNRGRFLIGLMAMSLLLTLVVYAVPSHWMNVVSKQGSEVKYLDVDSKYGFVVSVGYVDNSPLITRFDEDGVLYWSVKLDVSGHATSVEILETSGVKWIYVGGYMEAQGGSVKAFLMVMDINGGIARAFQPINQSSEFDKIVDIKSGDDGKIYFVGEALLNFDQRQINMFYGRYNPQVNDIDLLKVYSPSGGASALDVEGEFSYLLGTFSTYTILLNVSRSTGDVMEYLVISENSDLEGNDIEVYNGDIFIGGSLSTSSFMMKIGAGYNLEWVASHTLTNISNVLVDGLGNIHFIGSTTSYYSSGDWDVLDISFKHGTLTPGINYLNLTYFDDQGDTKVYGASIDKYIFLVGSSNGYGGNESGFVNLLTREIDTLSFVNCSFNDILILKSNSDMYGNLVNYYSISRDTTTVLDMTSKPITISGRDFNPSVCVAKDSNVPPVIDEFSAPIMLLVAALLIPIVLRRVLNKAI